MYKKAVLPALLIAALLLSNVSGFAMSTANLGLGISSLSYTTSNDRVGQTLGMLGMYMAVAGAGSAIACGPIGVGVFL
jgi:hypothetical protein